jgi:membrane protein required for colicin V production
MNLLDYLIVVTVAAGAFYGVTKGSLRMAASVASLVAAIWLASALYAPGEAFVERQLGVNPTAGGAISYIVIFVVVFLGIDAAGKGVVRLIHFARLGWADRLAGAGVGAAFAATVAGLMITALTAMLPSRAVLLRESRLAPQLLVYNEVLASLIPEELENSYRSKRDDLAAFWERHLQTAAKKKKERAAGEPTPAE